MQTSAAVWINPRGPLDRVTLLWEEALVVANPSAEAALRVPERLAAGERPEPLLGTNVTVIPLAMITAARGDQQSSSLKVYYRAGGRNRMTLINFADRATRDTALTTLQQRLGASFSLSEQRLTPLQAAIKPGLLLLIAAFFVFAGYLGAVEIASGETYDVHGRGALLKWAYVALVSLLGPKGILIVGLFILTTLLVWLAQRVNKPPVLLMLTRTKQVEL